MRYADTPEKRPRWRINTAYRVTTRLQVGLEFNLAVGEVTPTANWTLSPQTVRWPLVNLGTSSDRIGTPEGKQAYYLTFAKGVSALRSAPYFSINYSETDKKFNFPFGVNVSLAPHWDFLPLYDGNRTHLLLTYKERDWNVSLIAIYLRRPGVSVGFAF